MARGKRCPMPGLKVKLATGQVGTVVKASTPAGRTTCEGPAVFVKVGNRTLTLLRGELKRATKQDVKVAARLANFGPTPQLGLGAVRIYPGQNEFITLTKVRVKDMNKSTSSSWTRSIMRLDNGDPHAVYIGFYTGKNATSLRFPKSHEVGAMLRELVEGKETQLFDGHHRFLVQVTDQSDAQALSVWLDRAMQSGKLGKLGIEWTGTDSHWEGETPSTAQRRYKVVPSVEATLESGYGVLPPFELARKALQEQPDARFVSVQMYPGEPSTPYVYRREDLEQLLAAEDHYRGIMPPETQFRGLGAVTLQRAQRELPVPQPSRVTNFAPIARAPRSWNEAVALVENGQATWQVNPETEDPQSVLIQDRYGRIIAELDTINLRIVPASSRGPHRQFGSSDAEHATAFDHARFEAMGAVNDAAEALKLGQCRIAGSLIDQGYVNYGRMEAHAMTPQHMGIANAVHKILRTVDEPFEKQCVRPEPVSESHARTLHAMRPGLAGRK